MEISKDDFERVLRAATLDIDWKQFGIAIASKNPALFVEIADIVSGTQWKLESQSQADAGKPRADVIRYVRDKSGWSLAESKTWVDDTIIFLSETA